jgi:oligopeptide/dipeptide ABC transporter ATP-binding protein
VDPVAKSIPAAEALLRVEGLKKHFPIRKGLLSRVAGHVFAVDGVSFAIKAGETLGLVGESGCGKTTVGRLIVRLYQPTAGRIFLNGEDISHLRAAELLRFRTQVQMIFQDPLASLNPRLRVYEIIGEALKVHQGLAEVERKDRVCELLRQVGLQPDHLARYPHEFSGGQRQRIGIARALALSPKLIIADEPVSALDVSIQAQVINLLDSLKESYGLSYLVVAHDLTVVEHISDRIAVMYLGKLVELASDRDLYLNPRHPYTQALLAAVPRAEAGARKKRGLILKGDIPSPIDPPPGCRFHTRCHRIMAVCREREPAFKEVAPGHGVACFLYE